VTLYGQMHALAEVRAARPEFKAIPIVVLRAVLRRIDLAFAAFFRRVKAGQTPGYPRFRGRVGWDSLLIDDLGGKVPTAAGGRRVKIPLLGAVRFKQHRRVEGTPKAMRLKLDARGCWYVTFVCVEVPAKPLASTGADVGVDLGLLTLAATSDGECFKNPRVLREARLEVERAQRIVSKRVRGSRRRRKAARLLAIRHQHLAAVRRENHIRIARALVARYDTIYVEALSVRGLARGMLAKAVHDAGWGGLLHWLRVKAEEAAREVVEVNPAGTSQRCSGCGGAVPKDLTVRVHECPHCGLVLDRDVNAAVNILGLGRSLRRGAPVAVGPRRPEKINDRRDRTTPFVAK
jgi:putative transposase